jgi:hypothetical protein
MQPCLGHRLPHRPAELHDDRLLALLDGVERAREHQEDRHHDDDNRHLQRCFHGHLPPAVGLGPASCGPESKANQGTMAF